MVRIAKEFSWEMGHRLPSHDGLCRNIHGHSYKMRVELEGEPCQDSAMLIDYYDLKLIVDEVIAPFDHSFLVEQTDEIVLSFLQQNNFKIVVVPFTSTAENICIFFAHELQERLKSYKNIATATVRIYETADVFAEVKIDINKI